MAYSHAWEVDGVYMKFWGTTSGEEIDEAIDHIRNHPDLPRLKYAIADYLEVDEFRVTSYQTLLIAAHDHSISSANPHLKIALLGNNAQILETFRLYAESPLIKDTFTVRIFRDMDVARSWALSQ